MVETDMVCADRGKKETLKASVDRHWNLDKVMHLQSAVNCPNVKSR